ncbi:40S ribosomal protein S13 [Platysternon megacephalum]|uniref:40S ribosomal protein S13 n=1 Tax=Platysternon megacephalum TaxID=55544 RepID=A0A4D9EPH3_9SAUR|nr:40S ribosomal protein S13 [Platysternon megacephalum]
MVSYAATSDPLVAHLLKSTHEKIWRIEYMDIFSLLFWEPIMEERDEAKRKEKDRTRHSNIERNCSLHVGDGAVMAMYGPVLKYLLIICRAYNSFSGTSGLLHDEHVRMRAALNASLHWDKIDQEL